MNSLTKPKVIAIKKCKYSTKPIFRLGMHDDSKHLQ